MNAAAGQLASRFSGLRIAVAGDVMLDHFLIGRVDRISPEAPVPVVCFEREEYRLGGAANVAANIAALGGRADIIGLAGNDESAAELRRRLAAAGIGDDGLVTDPGRPTTRKTRLVTTRNQQVARVDYESDRDASRAGMAGLISSLQSAARTAQAIVLSDYRKGVVAPALIEAAAAAASAQKIPLLVDPKVPVAERYRGATVMTPNHHEAEQMTQVRIRSVDDARKAAEILHERTGASVLITWGEHGMFVYDRRPGAPAAEAALPAAAREVSDVTGAGDTVIAVLALGLAAGGTLTDAAALANAAAGLVVARFGPAALSLPELQAGIHF
jgi:D-beta-D-heptose 7-phosphate kinase/D-beta-D-heptose 1-phosphate adenosyltransferase